MDMQEIKARAARCRMAVLGDFCLDIYWHADMRRSELSRETPHFPLPVVKERMSAGGAGNVAANLLALTPAAVQCIGVFGEDWRGREYRRILREMGADERLVVDDPDRRTDTYAKPLRQGLSGVIYEDPRLDFTNDKPPAPATEARLLEALDGLDCDVLCVCDQMRDGCVTPAVRERLCRLGREGMTVVVDSRDRIGLYSGVIVKPNELEAARALQAAPTKEPDALAAQAQALSRRTGRPAVITAGEQGCVTAEGGRTAHVPAVPVEGEIDICGAGDTFMAGLATGLAAGASLNEAAALACAAAAVIVKKLHATGTATWAELGL